MLIYKGIVFETGGLFEVPSNKIMVFRGSLLIAPLPLLTKARGAIKSEGQKTEDCCAFFDTK
jgi:hypothetical protein